MRAWSLAVLAVSAALGAASAGCASSHPAPARAARAAPPPRPAPAPPPPAPRVISPADIAAKALPAVVTIRTESSLGTGFVVRADGWIATNLHVIVNGPRAKVTLRGDRELEVVEVLAANPEQDLALVRVDAKGLPVLSLGDSDAMRPGDAVVAIGNPLGLEDTVSNGLVSARRKLDEGIEILRISAPIAPGSSGGPIFNDRGEVIGVATAILEQGQNLNFGMPARYLVPMMKDPQPVSFAEFAKLVAQLRAAAEASSAKSRHKRPSYPPATLDGCTASAQQLAVRMLSEAIDVGAPLFNAGHADGCYHVYDGTASDLERKIPVACRGVVRALGDAQKRAASLREPSAQAWAMRDAFDGLLELITHKEQP